MKAFLNARENLRFAFLLLVIAGGATCVTSALRPAAATRTYGETILPPDGYVDRVEGLVAVIVTDEGEVVDWPAGRLREGDVIRNGRRDSAATAALEAKVANMRKRLEIGDCWKDLDL